MTDKNTDSKARMPRLVVPVALLIISLSVHCPKMGVEIATNL